jgi:hypothetical protein
MRGRTWAALTIGCAALPACSLFVSLDDLANEDGSEAGIGVPRDGADGGDATAASDARVDQAVAPACDGGGDPSLVAYFAFDETTGTTASDCSGHGLDGTILGATSWTTGRVGGGLAFDGTSTCIAVGSGSTKEIANGPVTMAAWANVTAFSNGSSGRYILSKTTSPSERGWRFGGDETDIFRLSLGQSTGSSFTVSTSPQPKGTWLHIAVTFVPSQRVDLYLGGLLVRSTTSAVPALIEDTAANLLLGCRAGSNYFHGILDEVRVYSRVLDAAEILTLAR